MMRGNTCVAGRSGKWSPSGSSSTILRLALAILVEQQELDGAGTDHRLTEKVSVSPGGHSPADEGAAAG
jgi:hypothetical protein